MIDIHCHLLPGMDDGPAHEEEALRMAQAAVRSGIHTIIATPHHATRRYRNASDHIKQQVGAFSELLKERLIELRVFPGQEYRLNGNFVEDYQCGSIQPLADGLYVLVEWPAQEIPVYFSKFLTYMNQYRLQIIVAHPERNAAIMKRPEQVYDWIEQGVLFQVNAQSLLGGFGTKTQKSAVLLCKKQWAHFLASDAHSVLKRGFFLHEGYAALQEIGGLFYVDTMKENARRVLHGEQVLPFRTASPKKAIRFFQ